MQWKPAHGYTLHIILAFRFLSPHHSVIHLIVYNFCRKKTFSSEKGKPTPHLAFIVTIGNDYL